MVAVNSLVGADNGGPGEFLAIDATTAPSEALWLLLLFYNNVKNCIIWES